MDTPGKRIKTEREKQGWSQQKLADEITRIKGESISRAAVAKWEIGSSKTQTPENFFAAAQALGLNPYWVLNEDGDQYVSGKPKPTRIAAPLPVVTLKPATERELWMRELNTMADQLDTMRLGILIGKARDLIAEQPAKQTPRSSA